MILSTSRYFAVGTTVCALKNNLEYFKLDVKISVKNTLIAGQLKTLCEIGAYADMADCALCLASPTMDPVIFIMLQGLLYTRVGTKQRAPGWAPKCSIWPEASRGDSWAAVA